MNRKWQPIVPDSFTVPTRFETNSFVFTPLGVGDINPDYQTVMGSVDRLKGTFDFFPDWPNANLTKEEDSANLGWHQTEFSLKTSFAYKIAKNSDYVGCAYIFPSNNPDFEVDCYLWVASDFVKDESKLKEIFKTWINSWPFSKVNYPAKI